MVKGTVRQLGVALQNPSWKRWGQETAVGGGLSSWEALVIPHTVSLFYSAAKPKGDQVRNLMQTGF